MSAPASPARRLSAENRREQILETAQRLFIERGFEGVGMNDLAQELGISRPTIYTYFTAPHEMLRALLEARLPQLWERLAPLLPGARELQPGSYARLFHELLQERELLLLMHSGGGPTFREQRAHFLTRLGELIEPHRPPGAPRVPHALGLVTLLLESAALEAVRAPEEAGALAEALEPFVLAGLSALRGAG